MCKADTSNVTDMSHMFEWCIDLTSLELSNFDTSNVTKMSDMFYECKTLTSLDLSNFDTSKITYMSDMFYGCNALTGLDISSKVTDMYRMFRGCCSLKSLDISNFDTSKVRDMYQMFYGDSELTTIYVSKKWNTLKVSKSDEMFKNCYALVGGTSTTYNSGITDKTYAVIDNIDQGQYGYLTGVNSLTIPDEFDIEVDDPYNNNVPNGLYAYGSVVKLSYKGELFDNERLIVKVNDSEITEENGVYTFTVRDNAEVTITKEQITYVLVPAKAATCTEDGNIEYYIGSNGKLYIDTNGTLLTDINCDGIIDEIDTIITKLGHNWSEPTYEWSADNTTVTATRTCLNDPSHVETEEVYTEFQNYPPTCDTAGKDVYSAQFTDPAFSYQEKCIEIPATGHAYGTPVWIWTDDFSSAKAAFTCDKCNDVQEVTAVITSQTTNATYNSTGKIVYTAKINFNGKEYTDTKEVVIPKNEPLILTWISKISQVIVDAYDSYIQYKRNH